MITDEQKEIYLKALEDSNTGLVRNAMIEAKIKARASLKNIRERDSEFKDREEKIRYEKEKDTNEYVEGKLYQAIQQDNIAAIIFYLKTRNKKYQINALLKLAGELDINIYKDLTNEQLEDKIRKLIKGKGKEKGKDGSDIPNGDSPALPENGNDTPGGGGIPEGSKTGQAEGNNPVAEKAPQDDSNNDQLDDPATDK